MRDTPKYLSLRRADGDSQRSVFFAEDVVQSGTPVLITEGPVDAALANQIGYAAVATRGLHLSKRDLPHLAKLCKKAGSTFLAFDAESSGAGTKGAAALGEKLWSRGVQIRVLLLPRTEGKEKLDLAEFILARGVDAGNEVGQLMANAPTWLEWRIQSLPSEMPKVELTPLLRPLLIFVAELAGIEKEHYRQLIHKRFDLSLRAIDEEMQLAAFRQQEALAARATKIRLKPEERKAAMARLKCPSLLYDFKRAVQREGVKREGPNILLLSLAMTSRLLEDPLSILVKGQSSAGKSYVVERVARLFPPEEVHQWSGMSAKVLVYKQCDYQHKILLIFERKGGESAQEYMRYLQSEKKLIYEVVVKNPVTGEFETKKYEHEGPVAFITTTTEAALEVDDENRSFSVSPDESQEQTAKIMAANLEQRLADRPDKRLPEKELRAWHNAQSLLAEQAVRIVFPAWFEDVRKELPTRPLRMRRDWPRFLALCEAVALLHQFQRPRGELPDGSIEITVTLQDYAMARIVGKEALRASLFQIPPNTRKIVAAVQKLASTHLGVTYREIMEETGMTYGVVYKWAKPALQAGYLHYSYGTVKSNLKRIRLGRQSTKKKLLPSPSRILKLHPELKECRYVDPISGDLVVLEAPSNS